MTATVICWLRRLGRFVIAFATALDEASPEPVASSVPAWATETGLRIEIDGHVTFLMSLYECAALKSMGGDWDLSTLPAQHRVRVQIVKLL